MFVLCNDAWKFLCHSRGNGTSWIQGVMHSLSLWRHLHLSPASHLYIGYKRRPGFFLALMPCHFVKKILGPKKHIYSTSFVTSNCYFRCVFCHLVSRSSFSWQMRFWLSGFYFLIEVTSHLMIKYAHVLPLD